MNNILNILDTLHQRSWSVDSVLQSLSYAPDYSGLNPMCLNVVKGDEDTIH